MRTHLCAEISSILGEVPGTPTYYGIVKGKGEFTPLQWCLEWQIQQIFKIIPNSYVLWNGEALSIVFFSGSCTHSHLTTLWVKHWPIAGALRSASWIVTHHISTFVLFSWEHVLADFLTWIITYFSSTCSSPMESGNPVHGARNKGLCPWLSIRLLWSQHIV